jgi:tRNA nucleotidyltransferase (CCA-adding enzyme)
MVYTTKTEGEKEVLIIHHSYPFSVKGGLNIMQCTKVLPNIQNKVKEVLALFPLVAPIVHSITRHKGQAFLVGGAVRDLLLDLPLHDLDIEVHGLSLEELSSILSQYGTVSYVGKSFGVLKLYGTPLDWSLPRTDTAGRKPQVTVDPYLDITEALRRRDLTMNAMAINLSTYEFIDPFGGYNDLCAGILRSPDIRFFSEDPLRFYRVMQFISRFEMCPDDALTEVCKTMDISGVSIERIEAEFEKMMLKSKKPSLGIRWLASIERLKEILPELYPTLTTPQDPIWHPEEDVFEHLMQTLDAAAALTYDSEEEKLIIMYAALCHDLCKVTTTVWKDERWRSPGHADAGVPFTKSLLKRITRKGKIIESVTRLVKYHMEPSNFVQSNASLAAYKRLALKLDGYASLSMLAKLALADRQGRNPLKCSPLTEPVAMVEEFIKRAQEAGTLYQVEEPVLHGRDIQDLVTPGPRMGKALQYAYRLQLKKGIKDKETLKEHVKQILMSLDKK